MYVRYQHARTGGVLAVIAGLVGGGAAVVTADDEPEPSAYAVKPDPGLEAARIFMEERATGAKLKDVLGGVGPKINLYDDDGDGTWDRGKVDRDRDDTWDSIWTREQGRLISRDEGRGLYHTYTLGTWHLMSEPAPAAAATPAKPPAAVEVDPAEWVPLVRRMLESPAHEEKRQDALFGDGPKVNLYDDDGDGAWDRAKVDRDRDGTWDEKWTRKDGRLERKIEGTGQVLTLANGAWDGEEVEAAAPEAAPAPAAATAKTATTDPLVGAARTLLSGRATGKKSKDLFGGRGPKVNLYDDDQDGRWDRAKVDVDRDDTWDEKWTRKDGQLERKDEATGARAVFMGDGWRAR